MRIYEIGTGYTSIPARLGAATEIVVEELTRAFLKKEINALIIDIADTDRLPTNLPITEVKMPKWISGTDVKLGLTHKLKRVIYSIALSNHLKKIIKKTNQKLVLHFHNQYNLFFFSLIVSNRVRKKCYIIYTNHSYIWHGKWDRIEKIIKKRYFQEVKSMKVANKVCVLNKVALENIVYHIGIDKSKVELIENGVNTKVYSPLLDKSLLRKKYGFEGKRIFIQVGSVCDRKNQMGAVKLLLPLMIEDKNIVYCYAGGIIEPEYKKKIDCLAQRYGVSERICYFGEITPGNILNEFYNLGDAMIFPSKAEGFSLVILEAMAAGVPVIIKKGLEFKLSNKCLEYSNKDDFCKLLSDNIFDEDKREKISKHIRELVENTYSWEAIASKYLKACEDLK